MPLNTLKGELRDLPLRDALSRVCVLIADPPPRCAHLALADVVRALPISRTDARRITNRARFGVRLSGMTDDEVNRVTHGLWRTVMSNA